MKIVLFDLGQTLESNDVLLPGARETLDAIRAMCDDATPPACALGIVSDSAMPADPAAIPAIRQEYHDLLAALGILDLFEPLEQRLTISAEAGVRKPDPRIFRAAIRKLDPALGFRDAIFITENLGHVRAARDLGMQAVHFRGAGQTSGEVSRLTDLIPIVRRFLSAVPDVQDEDASRVKTATHRLDPTKTVSVYEFTSGREGPWPEMPPGAGCARFGNQVLIFGEREVVEAAARQTTGADHRMGGPALELPRGRLHLVVQNGRLFQQEHPDVPIVLDCGRFLAVDLEPERARQLDAGNNTCFSVRPLEDDQIVFEEIGAAASREEANSRVRNLVDLLSRPRFESDLRRLASLPTRFSTSTHFMDAAERARNELEQLNYSARLESVSVTGFGTSRNVIADKAGEGSVERGVIIVCAHLDSINHQGAAAPAPGADDNASGSAGVIEMARVFSEHGGAHDLRFILFGGEEEGLLGSDQYVASLPAAQRSRVRAVVNMDMIATRNRDATGAVVPRGVLLEGSPISRRVVERLSAAAATYTGLTVATSSWPANSDHVSFINASIPAVLTIEAADGSNRNIHSADDTIDRLDFELGMEILRMNVAFVAEEVGRPD